MASVSSLSGAQSAAQSGLAQLRLQQAKRDAEQAEQTAQSLQAQARSAQQRASQAQEAARAITTQVRQFEQDTDLPAFGSAQAIAATSELTQATAQLSAGLAQSQKQMFSLRMRGV